MHATKAILGEISPSRLIGSPFLPYALIENEAGFLSGKLTKQFGTVFIQPLIAQSKLILLTLDDVRQGVKR